MRVVHEVRTPTVGNSRDAAVAGSCFDRAQHFTKGCLALAPHDDVDTQIGVRVGLVRETRIVAADDDPYLWTKRPNETDERMRGSALERHDAEADDVRRTRPHQVLDGRPHAILGQDQVCDRDPMM